MPAIQVDLSAYVIMKLSSFMILPHLLFFVILPRLLSPVIRAKKISLIIDINRYNDTKINDH